MSIENLNLLEIFKSYCEVLNKENDNWYGHADYLISSLPGNVVELFHYVVDDFGTDYKELSR